MLPGEGRGGEDCSTDHGSPPVAGHRCRDRGAPSASPPFPSPDQSSSKKKLDDEQQHPTGSLPEGALVEILSRVPYRSLCRFKCVSKPWLTLCSATDIRRRSPQTLSGFFSLGIAGLHSDFRNLFGTGPPMVDPSLPFLHEIYDKFICVEQCCISLLLCECWKYTTDGIAAYDYVVCNPATEKWTVLPPVVLQGQEDSQLFSPDNSTIFLGFDTAAPSRFVVFVSSYCDESVEGAIYSSETGRWTSVQSEWGNKTILLPHQGCVFLNGTMHFTTLQSSLVTVDVEGKVWRKIKLPDSTPISFDNAFAYIGQSQGRLHAWRINYHHGCQLDVWVLDYDSGKWSLKHTVNVLELFGRHRCKDTESYKMFAIHPECNLIFLTDKKKTTMSYDMDNQKVHVICNSGKFLGGLPYTPCFAEWPSVGQ